MSNRVVEIQKLALAPCWGHCPGKENPAYLVTRGLTASELMGSSLWMKGPIELFLDSGSGKRVAS